MSERKEELIRERDELFAKACWLESELRETDERLREIDEELEELEEAEGVEQSK